jgi:predicted acetyltransferase
MKGKSRWDLTRYATSVNVVGGFSKLLSHFKKNHEWNEIITFANLDYSTGNLYRKCGFDEVEITRPNYWYVIGNKRESRQKFMKHKLPNRIEKFDESMTEHENMLSNGIYRIYDNGSIKFKLKKGSI